MSSAKRDRIIPRLEHLAPSDVIKIFTFLRELIEDMNLDWDFFESRKRLFNAKEQYFVDYYTKVYLNSSDPKNYLDKWITNQGKYADTSELYLSFSEYLNLIESNSAKIRKKLFGNELEEPTIVLNNNELILIPINYKINLLIPPKTTTIDKDWGGEVVYFVPIKIRNFEAFVCKALELILTENESKLFFNNSFSFYSNYNISPTFLDFCVTDKSKLDNAVFEIYKEYSNNLVDYMRDQDEKLDKVTPKQWKFSQKIKHQTALKIDFMKVMFNAFPHIREEYLNKKNKDSSLTLENYLANRSTNIREK